MEDAPHGEDCFCLVSLIYLPLGKSWRSVRLSPGASGGDVVKLFNCSDTSREGACPKKGNSAYRLSLNRRGPQLAAVRRYAFPFNMGPGRFPMVWYSHANRITMRADQWNQRMLGPSSTGYFERGESAEVRFGLRTKLI